MLQASDAHLLASRPPPQETRGSPLSPPCADTAPSHPTPEHEEAPERLSEAKSPNLSACPTGSSRRVPTGGPPPEAPSPNSHDPLGEGAPGTDVSQGQEASRRVPLGFQEHPFQALSDSGIGGEFLGRQSGQLLLDGTKENEPGGACTAVFGGADTCFVRYSYCSSDLWSGERAGNPSLPFMDVRRWHWGAPRAQAVSTPRSRKSAR
ncbi:uncharacterized protein STAUR_4642 [Stigmatella aurantiaca DW4/3-1]|uniref:Uncharacterized protein n=1 Tax=Stigmatella aurantiaca (strain DW4/3-1) TaxID=378806 RepID=Q09AV5_STIAD|nr:uncharacterized protein STAUR_4642 [Stigmatella aurantiaca DW4/3-1]EAU68875.1 hypothetical protein STIAU_6893 [Stigmatella aurantiaca DW4/3-1]